MHNRSYRSYPILICAILCLAVQSIWAQNIPIGGTSPSVRWNTISTDHFKVIYHSGQDSLARVYARNLESFRSDGNFHTVVLHDAFRNEGVVPLLAPARTEVFTGLNPYSTVPTFQSTYLSIDAARAASEISSLDRGFWHTAGYAFGDYASMAALKLVNPSFDIYGRAYVDETKYIKGLRTNRASFLNYPLMMKDNGVERGHWEWMTGVRNSYSPDPNAVRYAELSGGIDKAFSQWKAVADTRKPYTEGELIVAKPEKYTAYTAMTLSETGAIYAVKTTLDNVSHIVILPSDSGERSLVAVDGQMSRLTFDSMKENLYWSQWFPDARWHNQGKFNILQRPWRGSVKKVHHDDIVNPYISYDNASILAVSSAPQGGILELNKADGSVIRSIPSPSGQRALEVTYFEEGTIVISTVDDRGYSLWMYDSSSWKRILGPIAYPIRYITGLADCVFFISDLDGSDEVYRFVVGSGSLAKMTSTRYGVDSFVINAKDESLVASVNDPLGKLPYRFDFSSLKLKKVDVSSLIASEPVSVSDVHMGAPEKFKDGPNAFVPSLWYPFYDGVDGLQLGATARAVNMQATSVLTAGYSLQRDINHFSQWRNVAHLGWTFSKFAPVLSVNLDFGRSEAKEWMMEVFHSFNIPGDYYYESHHGYKSVGLSKPLWNLDASLYLPLHFKVDANTIDIRPQISARMNNDKVSDNVLVYHYNVEDNQIQGTLKNAVPSEVKFGGRCAELEPSLSISFLRGTPAVSVFPKFGIGVSMGAVFTSNNIMSNSSQYADFFAFLPGLAPEHGVKFSAILQHTAPSAAGFRIDAAKRLLPRGLQRNTTLFYALNRFSEASILLGIDYAVPVLKGGINISDGGLYIKRLVLQPHFDTAFYLSQGISVNLFSAGASLKAEAGTIFHMVSPFDFGVSFSYNGGSAFDENARMFYKHQVNLNHLFVGPVVNYKF